MGAICMETEMVAELALAAAYSDSGLKNTLDFSGMVRRLLTRVTRNVGIVMHRLAADQSVTWLAPTRATR